MGGSGGWRVEELFAYFFGIYIKFGYKNPSILPSFDSVNVASYAALQIYTVFNCVHFPLQSRCMV